MSEQKTTLSQLLRDHSPGIISILLVMLVLVFGTNHRQMSSAADTISDLRTELAEAPATLPNALVVTVSREGRDSATISCRGQGLSPEGEEAEYVLRFDTPYENRLFDCKDERPALPIY